MFRFINFVSDVIYYLFISDMYFFYCNKGLEELTYRLPDRPNRKMVNKSKWRHCLYMCWLSWRHSIFYLPCMGVIGLMKIDKLDTSFWQKKYYDKVVSFFFNSKLMLIVNTLKQVQAKSAQKSKNTIFISKSISLILSTSLMKL